jgi:hypothetical protein
LMLGCQEVVCVPSACSIGWMPGASSYRVPRPWPSLITYGGSVADILRRKVVPISRFIVTRPVRCSSSSSSRGLQEEPRVIQNTPRINSFCPVGSSTGRSPNFGICSGVSPSGRRGEVLGLRAKAGRPLGLRAFALLAGLLLAAPA